MGFEINPYIEARMLVLTWFGKEKTNNDLSDDAMLKFFNVDSLNELAFEVFNHLSIIDSEFDADTWLKEAEYRANNYDKAVRLYTKCKGFPVNTDMLEKVLENAYNICLLAVYEANLVIPDLFFSNEIGSFSIDKGVLLRELGEKSFRDGITADSVIDGWKTHPKYEPIYLAKQTIITLLGKTARELPNLLSADGFIKGGFEQFEVKTSRNSPKPSGGFLLNCHTWIRHLIEPKPGEAFIKFDWTAQEPWIASILTGDTKLIDGYATRDIYAAIARELKYIPENGTKHTHPIERGIIKELQLGIGYGMTKFGIVRKVGEEGDYLFDKHKATYETYWDYVTDRTLSAMSNKYFKTIDGWYYFCNIDEESESMSDKDISIRFKKLTRQLANAFFQSEGAGLVRKTIELFNEYQDKFSLVATHFDAIYLSCKESDIDECVAFGKNLMDSAAREYFNTNSAPFVDDIDIVVNRNYTDSRGTVFYNKVVNVVNGLEDELLNEIKSKNLIPSGSRAFGQTLARMKQRRLDFSILADTNEFDVAYPDIQPKGDVSTNYLNVRYLPSYEELQIPLEGLICVKSGKGTGKTELLSKIKPNFEKSMKDNLSAMRNELQPERIPGIALISHRVALSKNLARRLDFDFYKEVRNLAIYPKQAIALSVDSLHKLKANDKFYYHTVIIDEVEQVLRHFTSKTVDEQYNSFYQFVELLSNAKRIILLDADVSTEISGRSLEILLPEDKWRNIETKVIVNTFKIGEGRNITMFNSDKSLLSNLYNTLDNLKDDENIFIAVNTLSRAVSLSDLIKTEFREKIKENELLTIHGKNSQDTLQHKFIADPAAEQDKYRIVIASPSITTGVSIDPIIVNDIESHHFTHVFGFFNREPYNHFDIDQAINRVRNPNAIVQIWIEDDIQPKTDNDHLDLDLVKRRIMSNLADAKEKQWYHDADKLNEYFDDIVINSRSNIALLDNDIKQFKLFENKVFSTELNEAKTRFKLGCSLDEANQLESLSKIWIRFVMNLTIADEILAQNRKAKFIDYVTNLGYSLTNNEVDEIDEAQGKALSKRYKSNIKEQDAQDIINAEDIDKATFERLNLTKRQLTKAEKDKLDKYKILQWFPDDVQLTTELIIRYFKENFRQRAFKLDLLTRKTESEISAMDFAEHLDASSRKLLTEYQHRIRMSELVNDACKSLGYTPKELLELCWENQTKVQPGSKKTKLSGGVKLSNDMIQNFNKFVSTYVNELSLMFNVNPGQTSKKTFSDNWNKIIAANLSLSLVSKLTKRGSTIPYYEYSINTEEFKPVLFNYFNPKVISQPETEQTKSANLLELAGRKNLISFSN